MRLNVVVVRCVITDSQGRILVLRRSITAPTRPLGWDFAGGVLDIGEQPADGIRREIAEETGLTVSHLTLVTAESHVDESGVGCWVIICYKATADTTEVTISYEHDQFAWLAPSEFQDLDAPERMKRFYSLSEVPNEIPPTRPEPS